MEALVGEAITFSAAASFDPDDGPQPLAYSWDFGDGSPTSNLVAPTHTYAGLGVYIVTLTVSDGASQALSNLAVVTLPAPTPSPPRSSGPVALSADDTRLVVANDDSNSISVVETDSLQTDEYAVCDRPRNVAWARDDAVVLVTCFGSDELWVVDPMDGAMLDAVPTGRQPFGVLAAPGTGEVLVANYGADTVTVFDADLAVVADIAVSHGPRALAVTHDGGLGYVTHFLAGEQSGRVSALDLDAHTVRDEVALADDPGPDTSSSGRGIPNVLASIVVDPAGGTTWTGAIKSNTNRGPVRDGLQLEPRNRLRGVIAPIDVGATEESIDRRIDTNDADGVSALAFSPRGRYVYLAHQGAGRLSVYDIATAPLVDTSDGNAVGFESRVDVGAAPHGVAVSSDGTRIYVSNNLSRDISVLDATNQAAPTELQRVEVTHEPLPPVVAHGKRLFFDSREPALSDQNYIACASCHPDSAHDGRTWDFTQYGEGLRNTIDLRGRQGTGHGPVHWTANFDEIQDFENDIQNGFGGAGLLGGEAPHPPLDAMPNAGRSEDLDALATYVASLDHFPTSPHREPDGSLTLAAQRGYELFFDGVTGCDGCHTPPNFTDSTLTPDPADFVVHLVGTEDALSGNASGHALTGFDTPTLLGVWASAPYLHDGRAATLLDVLTTFNVDDLHGSTSHLTPEELDDLVAFMLSLQGDSDEHPELPSEGTTGTGSSDGGETDDADSSTSGGASASETGTTPTTGDGDTETSATAPGSDTDDDGCACRGSGRSGPRGLGLMLLVLALRPRGRPTIS